MLARTIRFFRFTGAGFEKVLILLYLRSLLSVSLDKLNLQFEIDFKFLFGLHPRMYGLRTINGVIYISFVL